MANSELRSEIESMHEYALAVVKETIAVARMKTRSLEDSQSRDVALMDELTYAAYQSVEHHLNLNDEKLISYLKEFPELLEAPVSGNTVREALRVAIMRLVVNEALPEIKNAHQEQFALWTGADAGVWCAAALEKLIDFGVPVNGFIKFTVSMYGQLDTSEAFEKEIDTTEWIADSLMNLERSLIGRRVADTTRSDIAVLVRRAREASDFIRFKSEAPASELSGIPTAPVYG